MCIIFIASGQVNVKARQGNHLESWSANLIKNWSGGHGPPYSPSRRLSQRRVGRAPQHYPDNLQFDCPAKQDRRAMPAIWG